MEANGHEPMQAPKTFIQTGTAPCLQLEVPAAVQVFMLMGMQCIAC